MALIRRRSTARLDHPVIDIDGHMAEHLPTPGPVPRAGGALPRPPLVPPAAAALRRDRPDAGTSRRPTSAPATRTPRGPWWSAPAGRTIDLATALFPGLLYERLDELGIDFGVVYPSLGLVFLHTDGRAVPAGRVPGPQPVQRRDLRPAGRPADARWPPSPCTPPRRRSPSSSTPSTELGLQGGALRRLRAAALRRRWPARTPRCPATPSGSTSSASTRPTTTTRCGPGPRSSASRSPSTPGFIGMTPYRSTSSYVFNHLSMLAEGQQSLAKSLFLGGVTRRFPEMNFAFLEGGVAWAAALYSDIVGHWEKRNLAALRAQPRPGARRPGPDGRDDRPVRARTRPACRTALDPPAARARGHARRVGGVRHHRGRGHQGRCSSTASTSAARPTTRSPRMAFNTAGQPVRRRAPGDDGLGHRPLGRARHDRGARGGLGDGRARLDRRGRLREVHVRQPGPLLHRHQPRLLQGHGGRVGGRRPAGRRADVLDLVLRGGTRRRRHRRARPAWPTSASATGASWRSATIDRGRRRRRSTPPAWSCARASSTSTPTTTPSCCGTPPPARRRCTA